MRCLPQSRTSTGRLMRLVFFSGLALTAMATLAPFWAAPARGRTAETASLTMAWRTFANGDTVNRFLRDGDTLWAATSGGGLVAWNLSAGTHRQWLAPQDGLLSNEVNGLDQAPDGRIWLATGRALSVLDPATGAVTNFTPSNSPGMPARVVSAVKAAPDGRLWVGFSQEWDPMTVDPVTKKPGTFRQGGLARYNPADNTWDAETHAKIRRSGGIGDDGGDQYETITSENVTVIEIGSDGIVWVGARPYYVWDRVNCPPDDVSCTADGAWVLAGGGLAGHQGNTWVNWLPASNEQSCYSTQINDLAADAEGRMWVATGGRGLILMKSGLRRVGCKNNAQPYYVRSVRDTPGPRGNFIWSVDVGPDGRVWIGHGHGQNEGLGIGILDHNNTFDDSSAANQGRSWQFDDFWEFINLDNGPASSEGLIGALDVRQPGAVIMAVHSNRSGDGWGLRVYDETAGTWRLLRTADTGLPSNQITSVAWHEPSESLWVGTRNRGLARYDGQGWTTWQAFGRGVQVAQVTLETQAGRDRVAVNMVDQAAFDTAFPSVPRYVRFGDDETLYRLTRSTLTTVGQNKYLDVTPKISQDLRSGMPVFNVLRGPPSNAATQVCFGSDGQVYAGGRETIWLGNACPPQWGQECWLDGGLGQFDGSLWQVYDHQVLDGNGKSIPDQEIQSCAVDKQGRIWVGTGDARSAEGDGIAFLNPVTGNWTAWRQGQGSPFAGNGVSDIDIDPLTGDVWAVHHPTQDCVSGPFGGSCNFVRIGGGVSRYDGTKWDMWQKPGAPLKAYGRQGELASVLVDRVGGRVWAGGWDAREKGFHWGDGVGIHASLNWCPLDCTNAAWQSKTWPDEGVVTSLAQDADGRLWAGVHRSGTGITPPEAGIKLFDGGTWQTYTPENSGLPSNEISALEAAGAIMWVGTLRRGLAEYGGAVPPTPTAVPTRGGTEVTPTAAGTEPTPTAAVTGTGTVAPTATASGTNATATSWATAEPRPPAPLYLPFSSQRLTCRPCPTLPPQPTATPRTPTATPVASPTATPVGPAATASHTPTTTPVVTATDAPTATPTLPPPTATPIATHTPSALPPSATPTTAPAQWSVVTGLGLPNTALFSVTGLDNGRVFIVGAGGKAYMWDGQGLTPITLTTANSLRKVSFASQTQGYIVGDGGFIYETRNGGQTWRTMSTSGYFDDWYAVDVFRDEEGYRGWVLGYGKGTRLYFNGSTWEPRTADDRNPAHKYTGVKMMGPNSAIAIRGDDSGARLMTWNGSLWSPGPSTAGPLYDLHVPALERGVAAGYRGAVWLMGADGQWSAMATKPNTLSQNLHAVHMLAENDLWVAGGRSQVFHWDGSSWDNHTVAVPNTPTIRDLWFNSDGSEGWAVGDNGMVLRYK